MKFSISISLERFDPKTDMRDVQSRTLELVQMAEAGGFEIAWTPEHHTIELTIGPNPFLVLAQWAAHTKTIRLGTAETAALYVPGDWLMNVQGGALVARRIDLARGVLTDEINTIANEVASDGAALEADSTPPAA